MKISMNSVALLEGLNIVTRALAARPAVQALEGVNVEAKDNGVKLTCSDGSFAISWTAAANVEEDGTTILPGKMFGEMMRKLPNGNVVIDADERAAKIQCMRSRSNLAVIPGEYPEVATVKKGTAVTLKQADLKNMIGHTAFAISTDEVRLILTGGLMEIRSSNIRMVGLDGFRLATQKVDGNFAIPAGKDMLRCVIPGKVLGELSKVLGYSDDACEMSIGNGQMSFRFGDTTLNCTLLAGEYVDYNRIIPEAYKTEIQVLKSDLAEAIDRANLIAREGKNNLLKMRIAGNSLQISSNAEIGAVVEEMEIVHMGGDLDIAFNSRFIAEAIKNVDGDKVNLRFNDKTSPCVFVPEQGEDWMYLLLPVRTQG